MSVQEHPPRVLQVPIRVFSFAVTVHTQLVQGGGRTGIDFTRSNRDSR